MLISKVSSSFGLCSHKPGACHYPGNFSFRRTFAESQTDPRDFKLGLGVDAIYGSDQRTLAGDWVVMVPYSPALYAIPRLLL